MTIRPTAYCKWNDRDCRARLNASRYAGPRRSGVVQIRNEPVASVRRREPQDPLAGRPPALGPFDSRAQRVLLACPHHTTHAGALRVRDRQATPWWCGRLVDLRPCTPHIDPGGTRCRPHAYAEDTARRRALPRHVHRRSAYAAARSVQKIADHSGHHPRLTSSPLTPIPRSKRMFPMTTAALFDPHDPPGCLDGHRMHSAATRRGYQVRG